MAISTAEKVVSIALSFVGAKKGSKKHKLLIDTFNKVKPHGYTARTTDPWCAEAWSAWQILAGNTAKNVPLSASCAQIISDAKSLGIWIESDAFVPSKGDGILYDWQDSGKGDDTGAPDHIGMVYDVDNKYIYVVEGNKGAQSVCGKRAIAINGKFIRGFVHPHYADSKPIESVEVDGYWGYYTTMLAQKIFGTTQDGIVSGQTTANKVYLPNASTSSWQFSKNGGGSALIRAIQKQIGTTADGYFGQESVKALQKWLKGKGYYNGKIDGTMGANTVKAWQNWLNDKSAGKEKSTKTTAQKIAEEAIALAWPKGTASSKYAYKGGSATRAYKAAEKKWYPSVSNLSECHVFVATTLAEVGIKGMPVDKWTNILAWLRKNFTEIKVNYTQAQLKAGDIRVHKNSNGGYHIWLITDNKGTRAEAAHNKTFPHINPSNSGNVKKHKADWLFRAK